MKRIYRSSNEKKLAGICGALGEFTNIDPTLIRLLFVFIALITGIMPLVVTYLIGWIIIPTEDEVRPNDTAKPDADVQ